MTTTYTSTATVMLSPTPGNPLTPEAASGSTIQFTVAMQTEAEVARTPAIRELVSEQLGRLAPDVGEVLAVDSPQNTQMLEIAFTSTRPDVAQEAAQAFAEGYLSYRAGRASQSQQTRIETLQLQLDQTDEELRRATAEASEEGATSYASREVELLVDRITRLSSSLSAAEAVGTDPGSVINPAAAPEAADGIPRGLILAVAALVGLVMGALLAMLLEWRRDLIHDADEAEEVGVPIFATVRPANHNELVTVAGEQVHESYRRLRAGVIANGKRPHVLAVAGFDSDHASAVATNLALVLAEAKFSVLLVAADPLGSQVEDILDIRDQPGWSEVVRHELPAREALSKLHGFSVLSGGADPIGVRELNAGPAFKKLVTDFRSDFDYVVFASAPAGSADGDAVISAADSVLLVLRSDHTTKGRLLAALERFEILGIVPLGAAKVVASGAGVGDKRQSRTETVAVESERAAERVRASAHT